MERRNAFRRMEWLYLLKVVSVGLRKVETFQSLQPSNSSASILPPVHVPCLLCRQMCSAGRQAQSTVDGSKEVTPTLSGAPSLERACTPGGSLPFNSSTHNQDPSFERCTANTRHGACSYLCLVFACRPSARNQRAAFSQEPEDQSTHIFPSVRPVPRQTFLRVYRKSCRGPRNSAAITCAG